MKKKTFAERLINWYTERKRDLPWRENTNPYSVWLSEIILQQTRVAQGLPYWERFMHEFPEVSDLANASESKVLRLWEGLGYYSRARNLHAAAKHIQNELAGEFPSTYDGILKLKGVGPYTAAAIASICFNEPTPVVDGNVFRFASRYFGISEDISKSTSRSLFEKRLSDEIPGDRPGDFNQAMMEFGSTVCAPKPTCNDCIYQEGCFAYAKNLQSFLPVKKSKTKVRDRYLNYLVFQTDKHWLMNKREEKDVWQGLFDFYLYEGEKIEEEVLEKARELLQNSDFRLDAVSGVYKHILSHQRLFARFYQINISSTDAVDLVQNTSLKLFSMEEIVNLPKPKLIVNFLKEIEA